MGEIIPVRGNGMNKAAFQSDKLFCPYPTGPNTLCGSTRWRFVEKIGAFRIRYQCKSCGRTLQYDCSATLADPYAPFRSKGWFKSAFEQVRQIKAKTQDLRLR